MDTIVLQSQALQNQMARWTNQMVLGEEAYLKAMMEQAEHDPGSVDWSTVYEMFDEMQADACYVDEVQGEQSDWRHA